MTATAAQRTVTADQIAAIWAEGDTALTELLADQLADLAEGAAAALADCGGIEAVQGRETARAAVRVTVKRYLRQVGHPYLSRTAVIFTTADAAVRELLAATGADLSRDPVQMAGLMEHLARGIIATPRNPRHLGLSPLPEDAYWGPGEAYAVARALRDAARDMRGGSDRE